MDKTFETFEKAGRKMAEGKETRAKMQIVTGLIRNIKFRVLANYLRAVILRSDYLSLNLMHHDMMMIGSMHFMDPYNFDLERVQRCIIHYATPDGRLIPFCTMNNIHRETVERQFAQPITPDSLTPLYDVEAFVERIRSEERSRRELKEPIEIPQMTRIERDD